MTETDFHAEVVPVVSNYARRRTDGPEVKLHAFLTSGGTR
jgi:hypothetical protein